VTDWTTISSLATAGGTLVLAVATFYSVRSANRAARNAERALQVGLRPVLFPSRPQDPQQKLRWGDDHWAVVPGAGAVLEDTGDTVYLAMSIRNVGSGIGVLLGWRVDARPVAFDFAFVREHGMIQPDPTDFRPQTRDLYVPPGDASFWQAAIREADDGDRPSLESAITSRRLVLVDLMYGDQEGGQRTISRFAVTPHPTQEGGWLCTVVRHWYLDRDNPRG
jgi:hypothetical protein